MNRLSKTESAVFKLWMLYFQRISFSDYLEITTAVDVPCGGHKKVSPYIDIVLIFLHFLVLWDCRVQHLFGSRVVLNPGIGGVRDVASTIISHEQTQ